MKIVIEIPDEKYKDIMLQHNYDCRREGNCERIIANGTPLPKGHGRLIDADRLKSMYSINQGNFNTVVGIQKWIDNAATVIEADKDGKV